MPHDRFLSTVLVRPPPKFGPHSVPAVRPSPLWHARHAAVRRKLLRIASVTALALSIALQQRSGRIRASSAVVAPIHYADFVAEASQRFAIPASWMQRRHAGRERWQSEGGVAQRRHGPDATDAGNMVCAARPATISAPILSIRMTTFWPAQPICGRCTTASARQASWRPTMQDRSGYEDYLAGLRPLRDETQALPFQTGAYACRIADQRERSCQSDHRADGAISAVRQANDDSSAYEHRPQCFCHHCARTTSEPSR